MRSSRFFVIGNNVTAVRFVAARTIRIHGRFAVGELKMRTICISIRVGIRRRRRYLRRKELDATRRRKESRKRTYGGGIGAVGTGTGDGGSSRCTRHVLANGRRDRTCSNTFVHFYFQRIATNIFRRLTVGSCRALNRDGFLQT